jgi:hypothetical protein
MGDHQIFTFEPGGVEEVAEDGDELVELRHLCESSRSRCTAWLPESASAARSSSCRSRIRAGEDRDDSRLGAELVEAREHRVVEVGRDNDGTSRRGHWFGMRCGWVATGSLSRRPRTVGTRKSAVKG